MAFQLHGRIRQNPELSHHSLQCLIQLSSLSGVVFAEDVERDRYLNFFLKTALHTFKE